MDKPYYHWYRGKPCGCTDGRHPKLFRAEPAAVVFLFQDRLVAQAQRIADLEAKNAALREERDRYKAALEKLRDDEQVAYLACAGTAFCSAKHDPDCAIAIVRAALTGESTREEA